MDSEELNRLFSLAYEELRRLATRVRGDEASVTLNPTALVNEAYLKLAASLPEGVESELHFKRVAARAMRQVLIEAARRRGSLKRGGDWVRVTLDERSQATIESAEQLIALDGALAELEVLDPRQARVVECRFFAGLDVRETAEALGVSEATITRDWRAARAWLSRELRLAS